MPRYRCLNNEYIYVPAIKYGDIRVGAWYDGHVEGDLLMCKDDVGDYRTLDVAHFELVKTFLLDLDGVIANFVAGSIEACELPITEDEVKQWNYYEPFMTRYEFWRRIHEHKYFWEDLPVYPGSHELVDRLESCGDVIFCTDPSGDDDAATGKIEWLKRNGFVKPDGNNYVLTHHKHLLAKPGVVLIDDYPANVEKFIEHGGEALLFDRPWNKGSDLVRYDGRPKV
jgi:5'(3')-deoxyribonucleotidase